MRHRSEFGAAVLMVTACALPAGAQAPKGAAVSQGPGRIVVAELAPCPAARRGSMLGSATSSDGRTWPVPAAVNYATAVKAPDVSTDCGRAINEADAPIVEVDKDGEVITGYLIADNYFELYVNGKLIAVDATPFVPFNTAMVRFRAKRPVTYAVRLVDWEETPGLGVERTAAGAHHPGDGGFLARFSDGTITDSTWKAQAFYIAPLASPADVVIDGSVRRTPKLARTYPEAPDQAACGDACYALHWPEPKGWETRGFADAGWPAARRFTPAQMGVNNIPGYAAFLARFGSAEPIWSDNLVLDNLVLARKTGPK